MVASEILGAIRRRLQRVIYGSREASPRLLMRTALEVRNLVKEYPGLRAVDDVSFSVREGICFGLLGPNGAGKTTTVEIIEGVKLATSGEIDYFGEPAGRKFREEVGIQFQNTALQDFLTVGETLTMFSKLYDRRADLQQIIDDCSVGGATVAR